MPVEATAERVYPIAEEDKLRAQAYALLARLLAAPPGGELLADVADLAGDTGPLGLAMDELASAARSVAPEALADEYH